MRQRCSAPTAAARPGRTSGERRRQHQVATDNVPGIYAADPERVWAWGTAPVPGSADGCQHRRRLDLGGPAQRIVRQPAELGSTAPAGLCLRGQARCATGTPRSRLSRLPPAPDRRNLADWAGVPIYVLNVERAYSVLWATPTPLDASATLQAAWDAATSTSHPRYDDAIKVDSGANPGRTTPSRSASTAATTTSATGRWMTTASSPSPRSARSMRAASS